MNIRVLIVDNEQSLAETVSDALQRKGYECVTAFGGIDGCKRLDESTFDVIITDLVMEDKDGLAVLEHSKQVQPQAQVIMMTGHGSVPSAVTAMSMGAFTYLQKPLDLQQLRNVVEKASENARLRFENRQLQERLDQKFGFNGIIGSSAAMMAVIERLKRIAPTVATVLIQGETGTGKELIAQALHQNSPRKNKPFVGLNCAALSETILESELFGHVRGAFTDAISDRVGKLEYAKGGTLFLDEVGDMPIATQIKLLRVLESNEISRVGSNQTIKVDVRLVSATNRDLEQAVNAGTFRADLYHRLKVVTVRLPGLRQRREDIPVLVDHFVKQYSKSYSKKITAISTAIRKRLLGYDWPGNIRQLRNVIESMIVFDVDGVLDMDDAPEELLEGFSGVRVSPSGCAQPVSPGYMTGGMGTTGYISGSVASFPVSGGSPVLVPSGTISGNISGFPGNLSMVPGTFPGYVPQSGNVLPQLGSSGEVSSSGAPMLPNPVSCEGMIRESSVGDGTKTVETSGAGNSGTVSGLNSSNTGSTDTIIDAHFVNVDSMQGGEQTLASLVGQPMEEVEKRFIQQTLLATGGNREEAAKLLNIGQRTLYRKIKDYAL